MKEEDTNASGAVDQNPVETSTENQQTDDKVAYSTYKKALSEKKNVQAKLNELSEKLKAFEEEKRQAEEKSLKENEQYKTLWEQEKAKRAEVESMHNSLNENLLVNKKLNAFDKVLGTRLSNEDFYSFVDTDKIIVDDSGAIEEDSVKLAVESFRERYGDSLLERKQVGRLPSGAVSQDDLKPVGFEAEIKTAKTQREFDLIMKKYKRS